MPSISSAPARVAAVLAPATFAFALACGASGTEPRVASSVAAVTPTNLSSSVGASVEPVPTVLVNDQHGQPLANVSVTFAASGGTVTPATVMTDASGTARPASWVLGTTVGTHTLSATVGNLPPATFTVTAGAGAATQLTRVDGTDMQTATVATAVQNAPAVRAFDQFGNPVGGISIIFALAGGGTLGTTVATTDANGFASAGSWTLGTTAGAQTVVASIPGGQSVAFTATAVAGLPASITKFAGDMQTAYPGTPVSVSPTVIVRDAYDNPKPGVAVAFTVHSGWGSVSQASVVTGPTGMASVSWTLGSYWTNVLRASIAGIPAVFFNARGLIPNLSVTIDTPTLIPGGTAQATAHVTDNSGAALAGRTITWASGDPAVATVTSEGEITAHATGTTCITATVDGAARCANVTVGGATPKSPAPWVEMHVETTLLGIGESVNALAVPRAADGSYIVIPGALYWGSHNPPVAVVTPEGWIIALAAGNASISATIDGVTVMKTFTVIP